MTFLKASLLIGISLGIVLLSILVFLTGEKIPEPNKPYNVHIWRLPDDSKVRYYEIFSGRMTFAANLDQTLVYQRGSTEKKYHVGFGGSHKSLKLFLSKNGNIIWLMGKSVGEKDSYLISALDIQKNVFLGRAKMQVGLPEKWLTERERELKKQVMMEEGVIVSQAQN